MGYMHIDNLYKNQNILMLKEVYAMEKIHGTSAHVAWDGEKVTIFSGGMKHESFITIFDIEKLTALFTEHFGEIPVVIFGEGYGGKCQAMSETYGKEQRFVAFDVKVGETWLNVPKAEGVAFKMGLEFVAYEKISTDMKEIDRCRDMDSTQAIRNGCGEGHIREGIVLRPIEEMKLNSGQRLMAKHKRDEFRETKTPRVVDPEKQAVMSAAEEVADEWVTAMRLNHVMDKVFAGGEEPTVEMTGKIIKAMTEDILREGEGEFEDTKAVRKAIGKKAGLMYRQKLYQALHAVSEDGN